MSRKYQRFLSGFISALTLVTSELRDWRDPMAALLSWARVFLYSLCQFILWNRKEKESYSIDTYAMESVDIIRGVNVDLRQYEYQEGRNPTLTKRAIHTLCSSWETGKVWSLSNWVPPNVTTSFRFVRRSIRALSLCFQEGLVPWGVRRHKWLTFQGENLIELITMSDYLG